MLHVQVPESRWLADPPLLRVENEGAHAYLSMLLHLNAAGQGPLLEAAQVETRLLSLCTANLENFIVQSPLLQGLFWHRCFQMYTAMAVVCSFTSVPLAC